VLDECHLIKNRTSQRSKAAIPLVQAARRAVLLTGTAAQSRPAELFTQMQALLPAAKCVPCPGPWCAVLPLLSAANHLLQTLAAYRCV
jgi:hypothetical protein